MYGSDWPVCLLRESYANWVKTVDQLASTLSADEQAALWGGNAGRIYQLCPNIRMDADRVER